jgi:hypothetical protein
VSETFVDYVSYDSIVHFKAVVESLKDRTVRNVLKICENIIKISLTEIK